MIETARMVSQQAGRTAVWSISLEQADFRLNENTCDKNIFLLRSLIFYAMKCDNIEELNVLQLRTSEGSDSSLPFIEANRLANYTMD